MYMYIHIFIIYIYIAHTAPPSARRTAADAPRPCTTEGRFLFKKFQSHTTQTTIAEPRAQSKRIAPALTAPLFFLL